MSGMHDMVKKNGAPRRFDRKTVGDYVCSELEKGRSLGSVCREQGMPNSATFMQWVDDDPGHLGRQYALAREAGYRKLADEIIEIADKTHEWVTIQELDPDGRPVFDAAGAPVLKKVLMPLSSDVVAHKRLQVDTRKWMLSKVLPKVYGDKVTQEHTGAGGGPITLAAIDLKSLTDDELENMNNLLAKASKGSEA